LTKQISLSTQINASPSKIWRTLLDVRSYPYWNPFIQYIDGELSEGSETNALLRLSDKQYDVKLQILKVTANLELRLTLKRLGIMLGLINGELLFSIKSSPGTNGSNIAEKTNNDDKALTMFEQHGVFSGFRVNESSIRKGFENMSCALKTVVENTNLNPCIFLYS
jgi:hypothetical protein